MEQKCHKCGVWIIKSDDVYCSKDGAKLRQIEIDPDPRSGILVYIPKGQMKDPTNIVPITIRNVGSLPYSITGITWESNPEGMFWIQEKGKGKGSFLAGAEIKKNENMNLELLFDLKNLREKKISSDLLCIEGYSDKDVTRIPISISNVINEDDVEFYPNTPLTFTECEECSFKGIFRLNQGILVVQNIVCNFPGVMINCSFDLPHQLCSGETDLEFSVTVNKSKLGAERLKKAIESSLELPIIFSCLHRENNPFMKIVALSMRKKAQLEFTRDQLLIKDLFLGRTYSRKVYLRNTGGVPLTVQSKKISCNREWIKTVFSDLSCQNSESVEIGPVKDICMELVFHCEKLNREILDYDALITIPWDNTSSLLQLSFDRIAAMPCVTDYLAVDFGTTNTCIAMVKETYRAEIIPLEPGKTTTSIPTVIEFNDLSDPENPDFVIGSEVLASMYLPNHMDRVVATFKRRIGKGKIPVIDGKGNLYRYSPEKLLEFYIKRVINNAEAVINKKIDKVIVTYPPKFDENQVLAIHKAYENLGIRLYRKNIDEASAAAIYNILNHQELDDFNGIKLIMVADFGGGTTDLAIIKCTQISNTTTGKRELKVDILETDSDLEFGGEDVTDALIDIYYNKFAKQLKEKPEYSGKDVILPMSKEREETLHDKSARSNYIELRRIAETTKIALDDLDERKGNIVQLLVFINAEAHLVNPSIDVTREELNIAIMPRIDNIIRRMNILFKNVKFKSAGELNNVHHIFLAGKSSKMPIFREKIQNQFPASNVWLDHKMAKESVALGAAEFYQQDFYAGNRIGLIIESLLNKIHNDIGIQSRNKHQERIFLPLLKSNVTLPATGSKNIQLPDSAQTRVLIMEKLRGDDDIESHPEDFTIIATTDIDLETMGLFYTQENLGEVTLELSMNEARELILIVIVGNQRSDPVPITKRDEE